MEGENEAMAVPQGASSPLDHAPQTLTDDQHTVSEPVTENLVEGKLTADEPPADEPSADEPPADEPPADGSPADEPPADGPPAHGPPADGPPADEPPADGLPADGPPADEPPADGPPADEPPADGPPADEPPADGPPADGSPADGYPADGPPADEPPADGSPADGPPADGSPADEPPADDSTPDGPPADEPPADEPPANEPSPGSLIEEPQRILTPLEDIVEEVEEEEVDREQLVGDIEEALTDQRNLTTLSAQLQSKIAEYLISRKKGEECVDPGRSVTDQTKRYSQCMAYLESLEGEVREMEDLFQRQEAEWKVQVDEKLAQVQKARAEFTAYRRERALLAVSSRSGKKLSVEELEHFQKCEDKKDLEVFQVRLENIKLQNKIAKLEASIKKKEQLAEGLHMIDFEQLKTGNMDLNEKIEERNEEILKLRKKVTASVQVLTHVKEKLQFLQTENAEKKNELLELDTFVDKRRDHLTRIKQARDSLRMDNLRLKQKGGLVSHSTLLKDYEEIKDQTEGLTNRLGFLQKHHSELSVMCDGLRRKVDQAKAVNDQYI